MYRALLPRQLSASSINGYVRAVGHLSVTLAAREDNGDDPAALSRADLANHLIRLNVMERSGRMSNGDHVRNCIALRRFLLDIVALGLTTASQPAYGLSSDFTLREDESPRPVRKLREDESAGNALPEVVVAQLLAPESLAAITGTFPAQNRRLIQLMVDVGRRPGELVRLPWNCLEFDQVVDELGQTSRSPVLVHDMPKTGWKRRRLPIHGSTAAIIEEQQHDVRARFPETPVGRLSLWPAMTRNPHGTRPISEAYLGTTIANWMQVLPVLNGPDVDAVGQPVPFDRRKVFAYAFRHTFAQRHADAGTPIEVLKELMGHEKIDSTQAYYVVTAKRKRAAVRLMAPLQLNRNGIRTRPNADTLMSSEQARESIGALSVPFGVCVEPSNVRSHGRSCSFRYQCLGCSHFRTDPSYLPELRVYLSRRLADLEKLRAGTDEVAQWAAEAATPRDEEIDAVRNLIGACERQLEGLSSDEQAAVHDAIGQMRRARRDVDEMLPTSAVGRVHQPVPVLFPTINVRTRSEEML